VRVAAAFFCFCDKAAEHTATKPQSTLKATAVPQHTEKAIKPQSTLAAALQHTEKATKPQSTLKATAVPQHTEKATKPQSTLWAAVPQHAEKAERTAETRCFCPKIGENGGFYIR